MSKKTDRRRMTRPGFSLMDWIGSFGTEDIGLDLGTSNVVVYVKKQKKIFQESSAVAARDRDGWFAYGTKAEEMEDRAPQGIRVVRPLRDSMIVDYGAAEYLLNAVVNQSALRQLFLHPRLILSAPAGLSGVQRRALLEAAVSLGVRKAVLLDQPVASLIGMGLSVDRMEGAMVVDVGGGSVNISSVSRHGIVASDTLFEAGMAMDQAIQMRVQEKYRVQIGRQTAERIKRQLGIRFLVSRRMEAAEAAGKSLVTGLPVRLGVTGEDAAEALQPIVMNIYRRILGVMQKTPPTILASIRRRGIFLSGGGGQLAGLDAVITRAAGIPAYTVEDPMYVNAMGAGAALDYMDFMRDSLQDLH